jgi:hypothetical protein
MICKNGRPLVLLTWTVDVSSYCWSVSIEHIDVGEIATAVGLDGTKDTQRKFKVATEIQNTV